MNIYDVTNLRAEYVKPDSNLSMWAAQHNPFALCNASLYGGISNAHRPTGAPVGTIFENGVCVNNQGNGYGFGIDNGKIVFGKPWDRKWQDYLTGYTTCVIDGKYVPPTFTDRYVFDCNLARIAIAKMRDGRVCIITDDYVTLKQFASNAIANGVDTLVNLDGGGSRHLVYNGRTIYSSPRVPYNAIAFFNGVAPAKPDMNKCPYPEPTRNLILWSRGEDVKWLQWHLNERGFRSGVIDGIFGGNTWNALYRYQKTWSKFPDGICGPNTRGHINGQI